MFSIEFSEVLIFVNTRIRPREIKSRTRFQLSIDRGSKNFFENENETSFCAGGARDVRSGLIMRRTRSKIYRVYVFRGACGSPT